MSGRVFSPLPGTYKPFKRISSSTSTSSKTSRRIRIFFNFLFILMWAKDSYLNSPLNLHQMEKETIVRERSETHNGFYLMKGSQQKHLGFGKTAIFTSLTANPARRYKPPYGKLDRKAIIYLCLLLSGDIESNPGPVTTRAAAVVAEQQVAGTTSLVDRVTASTMADAGYAGITGSAPTQPDLAPSGTSAAIYTSPVVDRTQRDAPQGSPRANSTAGARPAPEERSEPLGGTAPMELRSSHEVPTSIATGLNTTDGIPRALFAPCSGVYSVPPPLPPWVIEATRSARQKQLDLSVSTLHPTPPPPPSTPSRPAPERVQCPPPSPHR